MNSLINFYLDIKIICLTATYTCRILWCQKSKKYNKLKSSNYENIRLYPLRRISGK